VEDQLKLVFEAEARSKQILARAEREAGRLRTEAAREAEAIMLEAGEQARKQSEELISRRISEAMEAGKQLTSQQESQTAEMRNRAALKMKEAVDMVLRSIVEEG
jgi:vacuolar-type H+-ATPase subunit H